MVVTTPSSLIDRLAELRFVGRPIVVLDEVLSVATEELEEIVPCASIEDVIPLATCQRIVTAPATRIARFDVQDVACRSQLVVSFDQQDIAIPCISRGACWQPAKHIDSIDLKDVSSMVNVPRLKHHERGFIRIHVWAVEREAFCPSDELNVGFYIVKSSWFVPKVLSREEDDGEVGRHGFESRAHP